MIRKSCEGRGGEGDKLEIYYSAGAGVLRASMGVVGAAKLVRVHAQTAGNSWIGLLSTRKVFESEVMNTERSLCGSLEVGGGW